MYPTVFTWPSRLLVLRDWEALEPDEAHHIECAEGVLVVSPKPPPTHQRLGMRLGNVLDTALGPDLTVIPQAEVLLEHDPLTLRTPDLIVVPAADYKACAGRFTKDQVRLAVEIIAPGSRRTDRVTKASEYADAGIPEYLIIDPNTRSVTIQDLHGHTYAERASITTGTVDVCGARILLDLKILV